jgi:hypothetical protein
MKKSGFEYSAPKIEELTFESENFCLTSSDWNGSVGVEGDYDQTEGEW